MSRDRPEECPACGQVVQRLPGGALKPHFLRSDQLPPGRTEAVCQGEAPPEPERPGWRPVTT